MKKVLIIDDEEDLRTVLSIHLKLANINVECAEDGREGLDKIRASKPDLIILDFKMPRLDGYSVIRELKADLENKQIPVIMLTANEYLKGLFDLEGIAAYFTKPYNSQEVILKVKELLEK